MNAQEIKTLIDTRLAEHLRLAITEGLTQETTQTELIRIEQPREYSTLIALLAKEPSTSNTAVGVQLAQLCLDTHADRQMPLVGLCGPKGCGKSTISQLLGSFVCGTPFHRTDLNHHLSTYRRLRFAGKIKSMLRDLGLTEAQVDGDEKETPCELLGGRTPREVMQSLGTQWGRDLVDPGLWLRATMDQADKIADRFTVIDDVRFDNEAEAIRSRGGYVIEVERDGLRYDSTTPSETGVSTHLIDRTLANNNNATETTLAVLVYVATRRTDQS